MEVVPERVVSIAESITWPDPGDDDKTVIDRETLGKVRGLVSGLIDYIEIQLERCKIEDGAETTGTP